MTITGDEVVEERVARVVALDSGIAWLEPEPTASCSGCLSLASCGFKGGGTRGLAARQFPVPDDQGFRIGERVVVGLPGDAVLRASATAYALPLAGVVAGGVVAQGLGFGDGAGAVAIVSGLALGLVLARVVALWLAGRGDLAPQVLRRVIAGGNCGPRAGSEHP